MTHRLHLPFPDPAKLRGNREEKLAKIREIRDAIRSMILDFISWVQAGEAGLLGDKWSMFNSQAGTET